MAITQEIKIVADTSQATASVDKLNDSLKDTQTEAKKADKSIDDVSSNGGAIAILDQLTGGLATRFKDAYEASKLFNVSLKATKGALLATGIGAFAVILGTIFAYWEDITEAITGANAKLQEQIDLSIREQESTKILIGLMDSQIALNDKLGKGNELLQAQRIELVKILKQQNAEEIAGLELQNEKLKTSTLELSTREKILKTILNSIKAGTGDTYILDKQIEASKIYVDNQDKINKAKQEQVDLEIKLFDLQNPETKKTNTNTKKTDDPQKQREIDLEERLKTLQAIEDLENEYFLSKLGEEDQEEVLAREKYFTAIERARELGEETKTLEEALQSELLEIKEKYRKKDEEEEKKSIENKIKEKEAEAQALNDIQNARLNSVSQFANLVSKIDEDNKTLQAASIIAENAAGIAKTVINTTAANAKAVAASPLTLGQPWVTLNTVSAGVGIASSIAAASKGLSALGKGGNVSSAGAGLSSSGGGTAPAPSFNLVQGSGTNQIAESLNSAGNRPIQAFVVSSAVTNGQELDRKILDGSTI